ncbi:uncharacterized protein LOC108095403 [Drosophila ficusphila]|uniref:uncharacterized protein LOC108095403 n=1 Tax=Drosophila ficusphila TaxID=30025 RepID=UPI0007E6EC7A|nr:uncharacterized protein LOC108095403 [Drosophila ficusphila]
MVVNPAMNQSRTTSRNFLRENRIRVSQNYQLPTASSLARRCGPDKKVLVKTHRPSIGKIQQRSEKSSKSFSSEKEIQTEDISDERFLSSALLKCSEKSQPRSEGDDQSNDRGEPFLGQGYPLRRSASNFELGKMPEQYDGFQRGQYTLHRPLVTVLGILPSSINLDNKSGSRSSLKEQDETEEDQATSSCSCSSGTISPRVRQMNIPEVVDVDDEDVLSVHSQESGIELLNSVQQEEVENLSADPQPETQKQMEAKPILLSDEERKLILDATRERRSQLIAEYNRLPLSMATLRVRNLKRQLEQQLDLVDHDLSMLSQAKVYLKQGDVCTLTNK